MAMIPATVIIHESHAMYPPKSRIGAKSLVDCVLAPMHAEGEPMELCRQTLMSETDDSPALKSLGLIPNRFLNCS